ncbi:probable jasmonic acid carboxyl methyltransferase 2 [Aristolochia californica]|uniref:probable jasmonic acid carboxyl methyltransferase 2 n=1 Tax=Aristolochia californica TaxID=171875 RepID=UPI0035DEDA3B
MEVKKILHMVGGLGENSYANNSSLQRVAITKVKPIVEKTILDLYSSMLTETLSIGDLGCSSGPNTLLVISEILDAIDWGSRRLKRPVPELKVFLNDLPGNDFNAIFQSLPNFYEKLRSEDGDEAINSFDHVESGLNTAKIMRAVAEPILVSHFEAELMDEVFRRYGEIVAEHLSSERTKHVNLLVTLTRRG